MQELARKHLDRRLERFRPAKDLSKPPKGWVRAIRQALEMTSAQLGKRLGVSQSRASALERAEVDESVTLATLRRTAEALDCTLVYALVPRHPLDVLLMEQAQAVADKKLTRIDHTMRLEDQAVDAEDLNSARERLARLLMKRPRRLWDEP